MTITIGTGAATRSGEVEFFVVDIDSSYNAIIRSPSIAAFEVVFSMSHQRIKFPTEVGVGCVRSNLRPLLDYLVKSHKQRVKITAVEPMQIEVISST